jgi:hypothetical protein
VISVAKKARELATENNEDTEGKMALGRRGGGGFGIMRESDDIN